MIEIESFIDLHTHTRYPDNNNFQAVDIEFAAINGGYSDILALSLIHISEPTRPY